MNRHSETLVNLAILGKLVLLIVIVFSSTVASAGGRECHYKYFERTGDTSCKKVLARIEVRPKYICEGNYKGKRLYKMSKRACGTCNRSKKYFLHEGYCKSCPKGTKRKHIAGLDTGYCRNLNYKNPNRLFK